jgi:hypothetical protein
MEDGVIYTWGGIDALVVLFDGLRLLFDPATTTFFSGTGGLGLGVATTLAAMIALIGTMNQYVSTQRLQMQGPLMGLFIYALVAVPTVDRMYISDVNTGKTLPVYDVPLGLAIVGYGMSLISFRTSELMENAFQSVPIEGTAFESTLTGGNGFLSPVKTLYALRASALQELDEPLMYNMYSYTKYCLHASADEKLADDAAATNVFKPDEMKRRADPFSYMMDVALISPDHLNTLAEFMDPTTGDETFQTCQDVRDVLDGGAGDVGSLDNYLDSSTRFGASRLRALSTSNEAVTQNCADGGACLDSVSAITTNYELLGQLLGGVTNARNFHRVRVMRDFNGLVSGAQEIDPDSAMLAVANINESIQTAQLQEAIEGETFLNFMMPATNFIIMLFYALFPLAMLIMITKGMGAAQYLGGYLLIGIWGYSIFPVATAINYITIANTREAVSALLNMDGFTPFAYDMILDSTANYLAVGSNLLAAAPIVTLAVITGSVFALTSVASSAAAPAGAAGSIAGRSSPQSHGQISELGLSPYMTDHKGNPNVSPVQTHSFDAASSITASAAYTNSSSQKIAANDVQTAKENLAAAKQQTTDSVRQLISRNTAGNASADETVLANAYQSAGKQVLEQAGINTTGYSDSEKKALETAAGYIGTGTVGLGLSGEFGSQTLAKGLSYLTGIDMNQGGGSNQPSAQSRGQVDPSAPPGSSDNPTSSIGNGRQSPGGLGASVRADAGLTGGAVGSTRSIDGTSNETSRSGSNSTKTGKTEDVTTTNGTSTNNSGSVKLSDEQQRVIEQHQSDLTQASAEYAKATERQRMYSSDAAVGEQFTQGKKLDLNDVQSKMNFTSSQAVLDYMSDHIDNGLKGDLTPKQLEAVKAHYENNAERERNIKVPGAKDATSMLVGAFNAADSTAFDYTQIAENPKSNNPENLTKEQAEQVAEVLSGLDSQLFSEINGVSANHKIQTNAKSVVEGSNQAVEGNRVEARASQETSGINYDNMGAAPTPTPLEQIKGTTESLQSTGGNSERVGSEYGRFFSPESIQNTIDSNAGSLGVSQGTPYRELNEEQQNQVLAHQTNQALDAVMGLPGIDSSNYESTLSTIGSAGIGQSSNEKNLQAIDVGQAIMSDVANNFNDSVNERKGEISQKEGDYVAAHDNNSNQIVSKSGYGTSSDFIPSMASTLPNMQNDRYDVDVMSSSNQTDGETLSDQQNNWNGQLQAALQKEVSDGNISSPAAQQIFDAHKIDVGSDTTVRQAYAGLVSGNVSGNYDVADSATEHLVDSAKNSFFNEVSKESGSLTDRMSASYSGAPSPIEAVNTQRENARFSTPQNLAYLSEVRDSVKARGGDVSGLSDAELRDKIGAPYTDTASGSNLFRSEDRIVAGIVNDMVNRLPENMSAREATRIIQEPIFQVQGASTSPLNQNGNSSKIK